MEVMGISLDASAHTPVLLLRQKGTDIIMPVWIGAMEALSISFALGHVPTPRPVAHDLLATLLKKLGASHVRTQISHVRQDSFVAELIISPAGGEKIIVDARPSDAIALALRTGAPVFTSKEIVAKTGRKMSQEQIDRCHSLAPGELALLFSSPQSRTDAAQASSPDDIFAEIREQMRIRQATTRKQPALNQPRTCQDAASVDISDQETLEKLLRALSPETRYKM